MLFFDKPFSCMQESMQLDYQLIETEFVEPVLRLYCLDKPAISIGRFQNIDSALDLNFLKQNKIECAKRITGGKALLHDGGLTYTILVPKNLVSDSVVLSYQELSKPVFLALKELEPRVTWPKQLLDSLNNGACFTQSNIESISYLGKKVVGSAQRRTRSYVLQHGEINLSFPTVFEPWKAFKDVSQSDYLEKVGYLDGLKKREVFELLKKHFSLAFGRINN